MKIKTSVYAKADRKAIVKYLSQVSVTAPIKFRQALKKHISIIASSPHIFSRCDFNPNYRHVVVFGSYVLFYSVDEVSNEILIYRILHGSQ